MQNALGVPGAQLAGCGPARRGSADGHVGWVWRDAGGLKKHQITKQTHFVFNASRFN
jgi:hypothetical protein